MCCGKNNKVQAPLVLRLVNGNVEYQSYMYIKIVCECGGTLESKLLWGSKVLHTMSALYCIPL